MRISRRQFASGIAGVAAIGSAMARPLGIIERRIYAPGSVLPPRDVLQRHGIHPASVKRQESGTVYWISFASVEARVKAWDRFNADDDWCVIREADTVALQEVQVYPAGKIFDISL
jgi:hypothetical protein